MLLLIKASNDVIIVIDHTTQGRPTGCFMVILLVVVEMVVEVVLDILAVVGVMHKHMWLQILQFLLLLTRPLLLM